MGAVRGPSLMEEASLKLSWNRWTKLLTFLFASLVAAEIAWLTLAQSYLQSPNFRSRLQQKHWQIQFDTISSPYPTSMSVTHLSISVDQESVHWKLDFDRAQLRLRLLPLFWKHLNFANIEGQGGQLSLENKSKEKHKCNVKPYTE